MIAPLAAAAVLALLSFLPWYYVAARRDADPYTFNYELGTQIVALLCVVLWIAAVAALCIAVVRA